MKRYPLLDVCARIEGHPVQHEMLREYCRGFTDWEDLIKRAEIEGMAPLLKKHLAESDSEYPPAVRRSLNILAKRHQQQAQVRTEVLGEMLEIFQRNRLTPLIIKGAALCYTLYPDPALRPMRDIDILFREQEAHVAQELLQRIGFAGTGTPIPGDHFHLPLLLKQVDGMSVCVEIHRGLYPHCPPYYPKVDVDELLATAKKFDLAGAEAVTFSHEETLQYLYLHGLRAPISFETLKLVNVADIIGFTEKYYRECNWELIELRFPRLYRALPLMHHISPWDFAKIPENFISRRNRKRQLKPRPFTGWPQRRVKELKQKVSLREVLNETLLPSSWWLRVYYGVGYSVWRFAKASCFEHPKNVIWWAHVYSHFVIETEPSSMNPKNTFTGSMRLLVVSTTNKIRGIVRKLSNF